MEFFKIYVWVDLFWLCFAFQVTKKQGGIEEYGFVTVCKICNEKSLIRPFFNCSDWPG